MGIELTTLILFASLLALLTTGIPIAFAIGGVSVLFAIIFWGIDHLYILASASYSNLQDLNLVAIPLFVLMGWILQESGIADDLFEAMYVWMGSLKGGLAMGTILISMLFAAICGELVAAVFTLTSIALPSLLRRGYNRELAIGCVMAGALLGLIIPPSIILIIYSSVTGESVGRMYLGAFGPGVILSGLYIFYIGVRCNLKPELGPPAPPETRVGWSLRFSKLKGIAAPLGLLLCIVGGIYSGAVTPMEAASVGAIGAFICAAIYRRLNWKVVKEAVRMTFQISSMVAWLLIALGLFTSVYTGIGAHKMALNIAGAIPGGGWSIIIIMQLALIIFGMFMDDFAVIMIFGPIFSNVVRLIGFDTLWFGILFMVNIQLAFLTPPYGFSLFCMRAAAPDDLNVTMAEIYRAALPFIGLQFIGLIIVMIFQPLATYLPRLIIR